MRASLSRLSIRWRVIAGMSAVLVIVLAGLSLVVQARAAATTEDQALRYGRELAAHTASRISAELEPGVAAAEQLARTLGTMAESGQGDRALVETLMVDMLDEEPGLLGLFAEFEPDAFDGRDADFVDAPGHEDSGRFQPWALREHGVVSIQRPVQPAEVGVGEWYTTVQESGVTEALEPYEYDIAGEPVLMVTASAPIVVDGAFAGIAAVDISLADLAATVGEIRPYETGWVSVVTDTGMVVSHPDAELLGQEAPGQLATQIASTIAGSGDTVTERTTDEIDGRDTFRISLPFALTDDATWGLAVSLPADAVLAPVADIRLVLVVSTLVALLFGAVLSWVVARSIARPVDRSAAALTASSGKLDALSERLSDTAERTASQANVVASAGELVSHNVATVAAAIEEMNASVREIADAAGSASRVATAAVEQADATNGTVRKLGDASTRIGEVVDVITAVAEQTNLLALNATIEAARAGEAGKGFAVVAGEVKELAKQTAAATDEIRSRIGGIQHESADAVEAISRIGEVVAEIAGHQNAIAAAVEQQTAATSEIGRNVAEAARGSQDIAENVAQVAAVAESTSDGAQESRVASGELAELAAQMQHLAGQGPSDDRPVPPIEPTPELVVS